MSAGRLTAAFLTSVALVSVTAAQAKDFAPGDLRVCNSKRCVPISHRDVLPLFAAFYYGDGYTPAIARSPRIGAPMFELRFRNGYITGVVGTARLDRFLSYGVFLGRFQRGHWYHLPARASLELQTLTAGLQPLRVTRAAIQKSR